jgi:hypothetical protein
MSSARDEKDIMNCVKCKGKMIVLSNDSWMKDNSIQFIVACDSCDERYEIKLTEK